MTGDEPPPSDGHDRHDRYGAEPHGSGDLEDVTTPMASLVEHARSWLAVVVVLAMLLPLSLWLIDELRFQAAGSSVVATLEGELEGEAVADAVLLVRAIGCDGSRRSGSAFVLRTAGGPVLVTNRHVVERTETIGLRTLQGASTMRVIGARLAANADVAVLEVDDAAALPPALTRRDEPLAEGTEVRLVGFPAATPFTTTGTVSGVVGGRVLLDLDVDPGASGSPVVGPDGRVGGQVYAVTDGGLGVATPVEDVLDAVAGAVPAASC